MASIQKPHSVLITGGSGALGHRIIHEVLKAGYKVRATCRPPKVESVRKTHPDAGDQLEVVEMESLETGDWTEPLKGIDAVIHTAALVYHPHVTPQQIYDSAVVGTRRLLEAVCASSSVKRFVLTASVGAFFKLDMSNLFEEVTLHPGMWTSVDSFDLSKADPVSTYSAAKIIAENIMWETAEKHPNIDFTAVMPCTTYGKFLDTYPTPANEAELNVNKFLYALIQPSSPFPVFPVTAQTHTKDIARAHVLSLTAPPLTDGRKKRLIMCQDYMLWDELVSYLREKRPQLRDRLPSEEKVREGLSRPGAQATFKLDVSLTEEVLGIKMKDCIPWQETVLEVFDWLLEWEQKNVVSS